MWASEPVAIIYNKGRLNGNRQPRKVAKSNGPQNMHFKNMHVETSCWLSVKAMILKLSNSSALWIPLAMSSHLQPYASPAVAPGCQSCFAHLPSWPRLSAPAPPPSLVLPPPANKFKRTPLQSQKSHNNVYGRLQNTSTTASIINSHALFEKVQSIRYDARHSWPICSLFIFFTLHPSGYH